MLSLNSHPDITNRKYLQFVTLVMVQIVFMYFHTYEICQKKEKNIIMLKAVYLILLYSTLLKTF